MTDKRKELTGNICGVSAYFFWGILTIYWKTLHEVPAFQLVLHRILWCFIVMLGYILIRGKGRQLAAILAHRRNILLLSAAALLIGANWFIYVFALSTERILQASLGYYINPLVSIFLGLVFLKEKLSLRQKISLILAGAGVTIITVGVGVFPWISICLALSFALYGLMKKTVDIPSDLGLTLETMLLAPASAVLLIVLRFRSGPIVGTLPPLETVMLFASGFATALPLFLFGEAAKRIPLSRVGFLQFLSPTIMFLIGVLVYNEPLTTVKIISFMCIWAALIIFLLPGAKKARERFPG